MKKICKDCVFDCKGNEYCTRDTPVTDVKTSNGLTITLSGDEQINIGEFDTDDTKYTLTLELTEELYKKIKNELDKSKIKEK